MEVKHISEIPVGALIRAKRSLVTTEEATMWAIKAVERDPKSGKETPGVFWIDIGGTAHPAFEPHFDRSALFVAKSVCALVNPHLSEIEKSIYDLKQNSRFGLVMSSTPFFFGQCFNVAGDDCGVRKCTLDGKVTPLSQDDKLAPVAHVWFKEWIPVPSEEPLVDCLDSELYVAPTGILPQWQDG